MPLLHCNQAASTRSRTTPLSRGLVLAAVRLGNGKRTAQRRLQGHEPPAPSERSLSSGVHREQEDGAFPRIKERGRVGYEG
eukprot:CAMPEP_0182604462 /NCGR_PEP_ID=MMETSP1324-20130603/93008_1 /TAXON_ID=236786 /ORGANISM="Florenciella sp., Strain RCC1587" /LENGTH=80 /DNA_ID=CAMNT_0024822395 /DNA_START=471 /DNA_END=709 /DNA_ORIENTATION=-